MRNLSASKPSGDSSRRGSAAGANYPVNQAHAKYKGLISTPGYCKFSAWRREVEIPKQPFSRLILSSLAAQNADRLWLKDQTTGRCETFGEIAGHVASICAGLVDLGFSAGDVVCMWCSNYVEYWLVCLAVWELEGVILPVNCLIGLEKLEGQLKETGAIMLVCDTFNMDDGIKIKEGLDLLKTVLVIGQDDAPDGAVNLSSLLEKKCPPRTASSKFDWDKSPICLMYTTRNGESKVVKHTNKSFTTQVFSPKGTSNHWFDQNVGDSIFCGNWFFHFTGFHSFALSAIHGLSMYFLSEYSDNALLTGLADLAISNAVLYPWQARMLSQSASVEMFDLSNLKVLITGGTILGPTISRDLLEKLPNLRFIRESYGMKEAGLLTYTYPKSSSTTKVPDDHLMPVGLPNMWTSFKVIDRQTGKAVSGPDLQGELCVKTSQLLPGYLGQEGTDILDSEGYFHTGDLGYYDKDGIIYFVEQISSLISFWMYEIAPSVLESRLLSHSSIVDAAVVAIPDKENGHIPRGFVVLKSGHEETEENLINFLESRLQDHERLRGGLHFIQHIPRDENWKVVQSILQTFSPPLKGESEGGGGLTVHNLPDQEMACSSPRTKRAAEAAAQLLNPHDESLQNKEPEEIFGMRSRSRRGSQENILESDSGKSSINNGIQGPIPDIVMDGERDGGDELSYWLRVSVGISQLEKEVGAHPGVGEVLVRGVHVPGVGVLPRAYVTLKQGFSIPGEELASWFNSRLDWRHRLRGGVVVADRLPRDPAGVLLVNLDKLDKDVVALHTFSDSDKYSTNNISQI